MVENTELQSHSVLPPLHSRHSCLYRHIPGHEAGHGIGDNSTELWLLVEEVILPGVQVQVYRHLCLFQRLVHLHGHSVRNMVICSTVHEQCRRIIFLGIRHRTGSLDDLCCRVIAKEPGQRRPAGEFCEVSDRCHANDGSHLAADRVIAIVALKGSNTAGPSRQQRQVPTRRFATHDNCRWINPQMLTIGPHPANGRLHILDLGRPWRLIHDTVLPSDTDIATLSHTYTVALFEGSTVSSLPPTPRQKEKTLHRARCVCWAADIDA